MRSLRKAKQNLEAPKSTDSVRNIHADCEDRCQLKEHKGYDTCHRSGECQMTSDTNSYGTKPADQEKARMLALAWFEKGTLSARQVEIVCQAFLELSTGSSGPSDKVDAERYRWLRKNCQYGFEDRDGPQLIHRNGETGSCQNPRWREDLDAAIDAEIGISNATVETK